MKRSAAFAIVASAVLAALASLPARADSPPAAPAFRITGDVVAGQICIPQMIFAPGDHIVWRAEVQDNNGVRLTAAQIAERGVKAVVTLGDGSVVNLHFGIHPPYKDAKSTDTYWTGSLKIADTHPTGTLPWTLTVTDAAGGKAVFVPIGQAAGISVLTIATKAAPPKA